ncbi:unnamed protein product [Prorocentrum cordatum]|uniref:Uncharacterized protein n=1 Tax=Prorocentrum cordatum TaxID=2364126 RepID=A0ABN9VAB4_9DINO|nr:unnamed protein product [Polarella glacialis]
MESGGEKARRHAAGRCAERWWRFAERRHRDLLIVPVVLVCKALGYVYVVQELVVPPEEPAVQLLSAVGHALFALFLASWLGVVLIGPGRVPRAAALGSKLPEGARRALEVSSSGGAGSASSTLRMVGATGATGGSLHWPTTAPYATHAASGWTTTATSLGSASASGI